MIHFKEVTHYQIVSNKYYLIVSEKKYANGTRYIDIMKGNAKDVIINNDRRYTSQVEFYTLYNMNGVIQKDLYINLELTNKPLFYEFISKKKEIYKNMEERSLRDIIRNIIGDQTFNHYLFSDLNKTQIKCEVVEIDEILDTDDADEIIEIGF